ncbi:hypothetical protein DFH11DRAFT_462246 [Phellopilus nigrolimitatus]|nr:hypothetical protein DFH11DRAFT_462246 [Phellopilus nigrolimitatus]
MKLAVLGVEDEHICKRAVELHKLYDELQDTFRRRGTHWCIICLQSLSRARRNKSAAASCVNIRSCARRHTLNPPSAFALEIGSKWCTDTVAMLAQVFPQLWLSLPSSTWSRALRSSSGTHSHWLASTSLKAGSESPEKHRQNAPPPAFTSASSVQLSPYKHKPTGTLSSQDKASLLFTLRPPSSPAPPFLTRYSCYFARHQSPFIPPDSLSQCLQNLIAVTCGSRHAVRWQCSGLAETSVASAPSYFRLPRPLLE